MQSPNGTALLWQDLRPGDVVGVFWADAVGNVAVPATFVVRLPAPLQ